jgi:hypothetical protein
LSVGSGLIRQSARDLGDLGVERKNPFSIERGNAVGPCIEVGCSARGARAAKPLDADDDLDHCDRRQEKEVSIGAQPLAKPLLKLWSAILSRREMTDYVRVQQPTDGGDPPGPVKDRAPLAQVLNGLSDASPDQGVAGAAATIFSAGRSVTVVH